MPIARREAEIIWEGPLARGTGTLTSGSGALDELAVTWASRTEQPDGKTSPEELIAAAHASCFAMALALVLGENKTPPGPRARERRAAHSTRWTARRASRPSSSPSAHRCPGSTRPISSASSRGRPISARSPTRCTATSRSTCAASSSPASRPRRSDDDRASCSVFVDAAPQPPRGGGRGHRARPSRVRSADSRTAAGRLRGGSLVRCGRQASPRATPSPAEGSDSSATTSTRSPNHRRVASPTTQGR